MLASLLGSAAIYPGAHAGIPATDPVDPPRAVDGSEEGLSSRAEAIESFIQAGVLAEKKHYAEAIGSYRRALDLDPTSVDIALPMAESFLEDSHTDSARVYALRAMKDPAHAAESLRLLARCDMYEGDAESAIGHLQRALVEAPGDEWTLLNLLSILQRRGHPAEALALIEPAIPENLATAHIYSRRAALRSQLGRHEDAIRDLAESLRKDPEYPGTEGAIVQELSRVHDPSSVRTEMESLLAEIPDLPELRRAWIGALTQLEDWDAAIPQLDSYLAVHPDDGRAQLQAGLLALHADREADAEAHLLAAAALLGPDAEPYRWLWRLEAKRNNWSGALAAADSVLSRSPKDAEGLWLRGLSFQEAGRSDEAISVLEHLLDTVPGHRAAVLLLSTLLSERERWAEAAERLGAYLESEPKDVEALLRRGIALERMGRFEEGTETLETLLSIDPTHHVALNYLGYMWLEKGYRPDEAMEKIQKALELDPGNAAYLDSYGWGYFLRAEYAKSIRYLEEAAEKRGDHPEILSHLGQAYEAVGRRDDALRQYRKALQYRPNDAELRERVGRLDTSDQKN